MPSKRSKRMSLVLHLAQEREDMLLKQLGSAQQFAEQQEQQSLQLHQYRDEYSRQKVGAGSGAMGANGLSNYVQFMTNLEGALTIQEGKVAQAKAAVDEVRQQWRQAHLKTSNLENLVSRYKQVEAVADDKKEQAQMDEFNLRKHQLSHA